MAKQERLWTDDEISSMDSTIRNLRRIRTAATKPEKNLLDHLFHRPGQQPDSDTILFDAKNLASSAGDFFASKLSKTHGKREKEKWQDTLSDTEKKYDKYRPSTYARTQPVEVGGTLIDRLRGVSIDPTYFINWELTVANNTGATDVNELLQNGTGVIAPLSGDYLIASTYRSYLERTHGAGFPLKLAAADSKLHIVLFEADTNGVDVLANSKNIGIYLDAKETGNTGRAVRNAAVRKYPEKVIHEPVAEQPDFVQSKKIRDYWASIDN